MPENPRQMEANAKSISKGHGQDLHPVVVYPENTDANTIANC
jgi:hypothetical protein